MILIVRAPIWTKILYGLGICMLLAGVSCHFFDFPPIPDNYMALFLVGGVILIIPYQFYYLREFLKYRPKE